MMYTVQRSYNCKIWDSQNTVRLRFTCLVKNHEKVIQFSMEVTCKNVLINSRDYKSDM